MAEDRFKPLIAYYDVDSIKERFFFCKEKKSSLPAPYPLLTCSLPAPYLLLVCSLSIDREKTGKRTGEDYRNETGKRLNAPDDTNKQP